MCDTPSHGSDHLWLIWKESIQNCRCYRVDTAGGTDGLTIKYPTSDFDIHFWHMIYSPYFLCSSMILAYLIVNALLAKTWNIWRAQWKHSYLTFWFTGNGLASNKNKTCDWNSMCLSPKFTLLPGYHHDIVNLQEFCVFYVLLMASNKLFNQSVTLHMRTAFKSHCLFVVGAKSIPANQNVKYDYIHYTFHIF